MLAPPRSPRRTSWNPRGTWLVEPSWNLTSGPPQTTPEPIWAETPKLSDVRGKIWGATKKTHQNIFPSKPADQSSSTAQPTATARVTGRGAEVVEGGLEAIRVAGRQDRLGLLDFSSASPPNRRVRRSAEPPKCPSSRVSFWAIGPGACCCFDCFAFVFVAFTAWLG